MNTMEFFIKYGPAMLDIPVRLFDTGYVFHGVGKTGKAIVYLSSTYKHKNNKGPRVTTRKPVDIPYQVLKELIKKAKYENRRTGIIATGSPKRV